MQKPLGRGPHQHEPAANPLSPVVAPVIPISPVLLLVLGSSTQTVHPDLPAQLKHCIKIASTVPPPPAAQKPAMMSLQHPRQPQQRLCNTPGAAKTFAALLLGWLTLLSPSVQAARLALVVGNDAKLMASTLRKAGFEVSEHQNLDRNRLYDVVDGFQKRLGKGDEVVFYFSGHGVQLDNEPMLLPTDIQANMN